MMRKLKVAPFTSDLGTDEDSRSAFFSKPCRIAVALNQRQSLVKNTHLQVPNPLAQCGIDGRDFGFRTTDQQHLVGIYKSQKPDEPFDAGILCQVRTRRRVVLTGHRSSNEVRISGELFRQRIEEFLTIVRCIQTMDLCDSA